MSNEAKMEVTGMPEGTTLLQVIEGGTISQPTLMEFKEFETWRKESGGRPTVAQDGAYTKTETEVKIWKEVMAKFYGSDWHDMLTTLRARRANGGASAAESEVDGASVYDGLEADPTAGLGTPSQSSIGAAAAVPVEGS